MPVIKPAASDYTAFVKASAQYVGAGSNAVVSKSGWGMTAPPGLGASVRASFVGLKSSPSTSALILQYVNPPAAAADVPAAAPTLPTTQSADAYIVKYTTAGVVQWYTTISGTASDVGNAITTDSTDVYVSGSYNSTGPVTLYNGDSGSGLVSSGKSLPTSRGVDAYIVKYTTAGVVQWYTTISGTGSDTGNAITTDSTGVYVTGFYNSTGRPLLTNGA